MTTTSSAPTSPIRATRRASELSASGARSGAVIVIGCGWNVATSAGTSSARASAIAVSITCAVAQVDAVERAERDRPAPGRDVGERLVEAQRHR